VPARRRQVAYGRERGLSVRRACTLFSVARSVLRYQSRKAAADAPAIERMAALAAQYPLWLSTHSHLPRQRRTSDECWARVAAVPIGAPAGAALALEEAHRCSSAEPVWSYDFVFDRCANGQQLKCLTVTDEFTKEGLAIDVDGGMRPRPLRRRRSPSDTIRLRGNYHRHQLGGR
jgi:putative transposase